MLTRCNADKHVPLLCPCAPAADNTLVDAVSCTIAPGDWDLLDWRYVLVRVASCHRAAVLVMAGRRGKGQIACRQLASRPPLHPLTAAPVLRCVQVTNSYGRQIKAQYAPLPGPDPFSGGCCGLAAAGGLGAVGAKCAALSEWCLASMARKHGAQAWRAPRACPLALLVRQ